MKKIILAGMALTALVVACGEEEGGTEPTRPPPNPLKEVLRTVEVAFNQRDIFYLENSISPDFSFHFDPGDVGQNPPGGSNYVIPESWSYTEFRQAVGHLLEKAYSISLTIPTASVGEPSPEETTYDAKNINIKFLVMVDEINGFLVDEGYCNFQFERYDGEGGKKLWHLTDWWDNTSFPHNVNPSLDPVSLGGILALYK